MVQAKTRRTYLCPNTAENCENEATERDGVVECTTIAGSSTGWPRMQAYTYCLIKAEMMGLDRLAVDIHILDISRENEIHFSKVSSHTKRGGRQLPPRRLPRSRCMLLCMHFFLSSRVMGNQQ